MKDSLLVLLRQGTDLFQPFPQCCMLRIVKRVFFFTTRFIESENSETAEKCVLDLIKDELRDVILNEYSNSPGMSIEEVTEIKSFDTHDSDSGFTWYLEDEQ